MPGGERWALGTVGVYSNVRQLEAHVPVMSAWRWIRLKRATLVPTFPHIVRDPACSHSIVDILTFLWLLSSDLTVIAHRDTSFSTSLVFYITC